MQIKIWHLTTTKLAITLISFLNSFYIFVIMLIQLETCKTCKNRKMDPNVGLVCGLTNEKPTFIDTCLDYAEDEKVKEYYENNESNILDVKDKNFVSNLSEEQKFELTKNSNFLLAIITAIVTSVISLLVIFLFMYITDMLLGILYLPLGAAVGISVRFLGKGIEQKFGIATGIIYGVIMLISLLLVVLLSENPLSFLVIAWLIAGSFSAYKLSFKKVTKKDLIEIDKKYKSFNS